jgi:hypothetical protein
MWQCVTETIILISKTNIENSERLDTVKYSYTAHADIVWVNIELSKHETETVQREFSSNDSC